MRRLPLLVLCPLLLSGSVYAQAPAQPPVAIQPRTASVPQGEMVPMQFPNADVKDLLGFYERLTNRNLIFDNAIIGNVNLVLSQPVSKEDAIRIIEINLLLNGFTLVPVEGSNIVKVIGIGKNPRSFAIPLLTDELMIPDGEHVVTFLAKLKYADPTELAQVLGTFVVAGPGGYTNITPLPKSGAILITENTAIIRQVLRVIHEIDAPPAEVASKFIELERADAEDVQKKLDEILNKQQQQTTGAVPPGSRPVTPRTPTTPDGQTLPPGANADTAATTIEINASGPNEENIIQGKIKITADKRTNRIHVVTRPANMPFIEKLIREFDANVKFGEPTTRPLKFVSAGDVFEVVVKAISDPGATDANSPTGANGTTNRNGQTNNRSTNSNGSMFGSNNSSSGTSGSGGDSFNFSEGLETEAVDTTPDAVTVGNTRIIADKRANSIIVIGSEDVKEKLFKVIDELDKRQPQVMFHVVIGELNLTDREQFGVDYILKNAGFGTAPIVGGDTGTDGGTTTPTGVVSFSGSQPSLNFNNLINQNTITQIAAAGSGGLSGFFTAGNTLNAMVTALENTSRFRVVSRPSVFTSNLKKAVIASGQEIAVPTQTLTSVTNSNVVNDNAAVSSSIGYKRVALQLEVVPLINADREVDLDILQKNDEVAGSTVIGGNTVPNIATRYVKTHVTVPNKGTLVLGGLIRSSNDRSRAGIPLLSRIPLLGYLFSNTIKENIRQELVILIRPEVSWNPGEDVATRERHQEFFNMPTDLESTVYPSLTRSSSKGEPKTRVLIPNPAPLRETSTPLPLATPKPKGDSTKSKGDPKIKSRTFSTVPKTN